jgi:hypothetical protein
MDPVRPAAPLNRHAGVGPHGPPTVPGPWNDHPLRAITAVAGPLTSSVGLGHHVRKTHCPRGRGKSRRPFESTDHRTEFQPRQSLVGRNWQTPPVNSWTWGASTAKLPLGGLAPSESFVARRLLGGGEVAGASRSGGGKPHGISCAANRLIDSANGGFGAKRLVILSGVPPMRGGDTLDWLDMSPSQKQPRNGRA